MPKKNKTPEAWRKNPDWRMKPFLRWPRPESLSPSINTMDGYVDGDPVSIGIINGWQVVIPVVRLEAEHE